MLKHAARKGFCAKMNATYFINFMQKIALQNENTRKILTFSQINFVFGYSGSGKTTFLETLNAAFMGKDKSYISNRGKILPSDFNVIFVSGNDDINSHLKLSSKSLLQKLIFSSHYSQRFEESLKSISQSLENVREEIENEISPILGGIRAIIKRQDDPLDFVIDNLSISCDGASSSYERHALFEIVNALTNVTNSKTVVLIDDFSKEFDEETILKTIREARKQNAYFILSSNKPIPQWVLDNDTSIVAMREGEPIQLPSLKDLALDAIEGQPKYQSFEEYMLGDGYSKLSGASERYARLIIEDRMCTFLRILTSKNPVITNHCASDFIAIMPKSAEEETIYRKLFDMLGIK